MNENYWKEQYKNTWMKSSAREERLKAYIEKFTGRKCSEYGLGAGSTQFISGSAKQNGQQKGDADLWVEGTNVFVEVTGPLVRYVKSTEPMWFRPDKIDNAINNRNHDVFLVHNFVSDDSWRVIHIDAGFIRRYQRREFRMKEKYIRGNKEHYIEVEVNDSCIQNLRYLIDYINRFGEMVNNGKNET